MTRIRPLLVAIAGCLLALACAGSAQASYTYFSSDSQGHIYAQTNGDLSGSYEQTYEPLDVSSSQAGLNIAVYNAAGTTATLYGTRGIPFTPDPGNPQQTSYSPYTVVSQYFAGCSDGTCLHVTETLTQIDDLTFQVDYQISNPTANPIRFRATNGEEFDPGSLNTSLGEWSKGRRGLKSAGPPQWVGALSEREGNLLRIEETAGNPWPTGSGPSDATHVMEGDAFQVWRQVEQPLASPGLTDQVDNNYRDAAVAVEWDAYHDTGLAASASADFTAVWRYVDFNPLAIVKSPAGAANTYYGDLGTGAAPGGSPVTVSATAQNWDGTPTDLTPTAGSPTPLRYSVTGLNPQPAVSTDPPLVAANGDATGAASVGWTSQYIEDSNYYYYDYYYNYASDYVDTFVDLNNDGVMDENEPRQSLTLQWFDRLYAYDNACQYYYSYYSSPGVCDHMAGATATFTVHIEDPDHNPMQDPNNPGQPAHFSYEVTGANTTSLINDPSQTIDPVTGDATFNFRGVNPGADAITVTTDLDGDGVEGDDPGETRTIHELWHDRIVLSDNQANVAVGTNATVQASLFDENGNPVTGQNLHYYVTGANPLSDRLTTGTTTSSYSCPYNYNDYYNGACTGVTVTGSNPGTSTVTIWYDVGGDGTQNLDDPSATYTVDWLAKDGTNQPIQPVTLSSTYLTRTVGGDPAALTATIKTDAGLAAPDGTQVAYSVYRDSSNKQVNYTQTSGGQITLPPLNDNTAGYDTVDVWLDANQNHKFDSGEEGTSGEVVWYDPITITVYDDTPYTSQQTSAYVYFRDPQGNLIQNEPYTWAITGANPATSANGCCTAQFGSGTISWQGVNVGQDTLTVSADVSGDPTPETQIKTVFWQNQLSLAPLTAELPQGDTEKVNACLVYGSFVGSKDYYYTITGANPGSGKVTDATAYGCYSAPSGPVIQWTGTNPGTDTLTVWADLNGNGIQDPSEPTGVSTITWDKGRVDLAVTPTVDATVGQTRTVTATLYDSNGNPVPSEVLRWDRTGPNAQPGNAVPALTDNNGQIQISWTGTYSGTDTVMVYADYNHDAVHEASEPQRQTKVNWYPRLMSNVVDYYKYLGETQTVTATLYDDNHVGVPGATLNYSITGANPQTGTLVTDGTGTVNLSWAATNTGDDSVRLWVDSTPNGTYDSGETTTTQYVTWDRRLKLTATPSTAPQPGTAETVNIALRKLDSSYDANATLHYAVTGANPKTGTVTTDNYGAAQIALTSAVAGDDTVEVWKDADNDGTPDTGLDETIVIHWTNRLHLTDVTPSGQTAGSWYTYTQHTVSGLLDAAQNSPNNGVTIRYSISGANPQSSSTTTDGSGNFSIAWPGNNPGLDTLTAYADLDNDGVRDNADPESVITYTWLPSMDVQMPAGTHTADPSGPTANATVTARDPVTGNLLTNEVLDYTITGPNPATNQATTDAFGVATIPLTGTNSGTDTLVVSDHANPTNSGSASLNWATPPITLTFNPPSGAPLIQNSYQVTAQLRNGTTPLTNVPIQWHVTGANPQAGATQNTDNSGNLVINWTGNNTGTDVISATAQLGANYNPTGTSSVSWQPLVSFSTPSGGDTVGLPHTETITLRQPNGSPYVGVDVYYQITGANPTAGGGPILTRPVSDSLTGSTLYARTTDSTGTISITWTGTNVGTDTLDVWGDTDGSPGVTANDVHSRTSVVWASVSSVGGTTTSSGGGSTTTTPQASGSAVPPGSPSDFDGLPSPPPPVVAKAVNVTPVSGKVLVRLPGTNKFIDLLDAEQIPVGSVVDVTHGRVSLTSSQDANNKTTATADFYLGQFQIGQKKAAKPITDLTLVGGSFSACAKILKGKKSATGAQKKQIRQLWGSGKGLFRTKGKYAAASIRGTTWDVVDFCDGTLVKVTQGIVTVTDNVKKKNITVKAPKSYFAAAKKK